MTYAAAAPAGHGWSTQDRDLIDTHCQLYMLYTYYCNNSHFRGTQKRDTHLQISRAFRRQRYGSLLPSLSLELKTVALTGGSDATRRLMLYLW
jgi:hypothetical protein